MKILSAAEKTGFNALVSTEIISKSNIVLIIQAIVKVKNKESKH
ncbi:hypothetical protein SPJ1_1997 [Streptococcus parauberis KRS-02083]|uniref:Uncharacterized protein n=1 Tax=Streptococcus parauberis KRS-02083 TaxID=1207545 RepID=A0ABP2SW80_9STRE|nr:hypothetical protein SPJ1_1997 [Streptococcus parauberis KRS-02083]